MKSLLSKTGGLLLLLLVVAVSALFGAIATFYQLTGVLPTKEEFLPSPGRPREDDREARRGLVSSSPDEIEMTFADADTPFDEDEH